MAARPRSQRKRNWPDGLYERGGYFSWRNPLTGEELGIGRVPLVEASSQAIEANLHVQALLKKPRLIDRLTGSADRSVGALLTLHDARLVEKQAAGELAAITLKTLRSCARGIRRAWEDRPAAGVTTLDAVALLQAWTGAGQQRMAKAVRSYGTDLFRHAEAIGWVERGRNPFTVTEKIKAKVKRARLTLEAFQEVYGAAAALEPWVQRSMALAIVSARRREDLAVAEFRPREDSLVWVGGDSLYVIQQKVEGSTGLRLRVPLSLRLDVVGWTLEEVVGRCRDNVVSRWLLHHTKRRGTQCEPGDQVWIDTISKGFARARKRTGLAWPGQEPPTFHEIRSLAARLYEKQGNVDVQALLGHTDPATTAVYQDARGAEWADVRVA